VLITCCGAFTENWVVTTCAPVVIVTVRKPVGAFPATVKIALRLVGDATVTPDTVTPVPDIVTVVVPWTKLEFVPLMVTGAASFCPALTGDIATDGEPAGVT